MYEYEILELMYEWLDMSSRFHNGDIPISLLDYINLRRSSGEVKFIDKTEWNRIKEYRRKKQNIDEKLEQINTDFE